MPQAVLKELAVLAVLLATIHIGVHLNIINSAAEAAEAVVALVVATPRQSEPVALEAVVAPAVPLDSVRQLVIHLMMNQKISLVVGPVVAQVVAELTTMAVVLAENFRGLVRGPMLLNIGAGENPEALLAVPAPQVPQSRLIRTTSSHTMC